LCNFQGLSDDIVEELEEKVSSLESDKKDLQNRIREYVKRIEEIESENEKLNQQLKQTTGTCKFNSKLTFSPFNRKD
jgi:prefoldin subunit 5